MFRPLDCRVPRRSVLLRYGGVAAGIGMGLLSAACGGAASGAVATSSSAPSVSASTSAVVSSSASAASASTAARVTMTTNSVVPTTSSAVSATASAISASATGTTPQAAPSGAEKAAITVQYYTSLNQRQQQLFPTMVSQPFEQRNPNLSIEVVQSQGSFYAKLTTMVAAGTPPDVVWEAYPEAYLGKLITDVSGYVNRDKLDMSIYPKFAMDYDGIWQGKILGLPNQTGGNWPVMPFNHDLFAKASLSDPPEQWGTKTWDYQAFVDAGQKLSPLGPDGAPQSFMLNDPGLGTIMLYWGLRYGGQWLSDDFTTITCDSEQMITGLQQLFDLALKHKVMAKPGQLKQVFGDTNVMNLLKAGKLACAIDSGGDMYNVAVNDQAGANLAFGVQPTFPASAGCDQDVDPNGLASGTKHPEEGWAFIRFQSDTPGWAISRGNLPARQDHLAAWEQALWSGSVGEKARVKVYEASLANSAKKDPFGHLSNWRDMYTNIIQPELNKVWAGQTTIADVLRAVKPQLQSQMKRPT